MIRRFIGMLVLLLCVMMVTPAYAAEHVNPITLYQEAVKVEHLVKQGEKPTVVLESLNALSDQYTRLDTRGISQKIEGLHAVAAELIALKQMYAAVKGPEQAVAEFRIHRIVVAFDSLAYPNSPSWLPIARSMENNLEKVIDSVAKQDQKTAKSLFGKVRSERDQIWLALQLHGNPGELYLQQSAHRFIETQLAGEQVTDKQSTLDSLGSYKGSLGSVTAQIQVVEEPPLLPVFHVTLSPTMYGTAGGVLLLGFGWRVLRKKKN